MALHCKTISLCEDWSLFSKEQYNRGLPKCELPLLKYLSDLKNIKSQKLPTTHLYPEIPTLNWLQHSEWFISEYQFECSGSDLCFPIQNLIIYLSIS